MKRRFPALLLVVAAVVGLVVTARDRLDAQPPTFSFTASGWMPFAPAATGLTETWFCPGVPATGADGIEGAVVIANRGEERMIGTILLINDEGASHRLDLAVDGWASATVDLDATLPGAVVGAVIEVDGGGAIVEQQAFHPGGDSVAPCSNATSDRWYLADGFTVDSSLDQLVLTNPYDQTVVVNIEFATQEGPRRPNSYRGLTVPARGIRIIDLGAPGAGAQSEPILAVAVEASRGRLVVGRSQHFLGGGRLGTQVSLASPAVRDQWWFVGGQIGDGVSERYSIYNPTDDDVEVDPIFVAIPTAVQADPIEVPAGEVRTFDPTTVTESNTKVSSSRRCPTDRTPWCSRRWRHNPSWSNGRRPRRSATPSRPPSSPERRRGRTDTSPPSGTSPPVRVSRSRTASSSTTPTMQRASCRCSPSVGPARSRSRGSRI